MYYPRYHRQTNSTKKEIPRLEKFESLSLEDLTKIKTYFSSLAEKTKEINAQNSKIRNSNNDIESKNEHIRKQESDRDSRMQEDYRKKYIEPIESNMEKIWNHLYAHKVGTVDRFIFMMDTIEINVRYPNFRIKKSDIAEKLLSDYKQLQSRRGDLMQRMPTLPRTPPTPPLPLKKIPNDYIDIILNGVRARVFRESVKLDMIESLISKKHNQNAIEKEKIDNLKARAAQKEQEVRSQAKQFLASGLKEQMKILVHCPYCMGELNHKNAHQDHIHPVSKGGLSTKKNLVFVCSSCNLKKKDRTLGVFCAQENISVLLVHKNLTLLRKDF